MSDSVVGLTMEERLLNTVREEYPEAICWEEREGHYVLTLCPRNADVGRGAEIATALFGMSPADNVALAVAYTLGKLN
jgi:hypothetical protein